MQLWYFSHLLYGIISNGYNGFVFFTALFGFHFGHVVQFVSIFLILSKSCSDEANNFLLGSMQFFES